MAHATQLYAIAVGSNRPHGRHGRPSGVVGAAIAELDRTFGLFDASPVLLNPASGLSGRDFANAVVLVTSDLSPREVLTRVKAIERAFGRRGGKHWSSRVLDLDLILWSSGAVSQPGLSIPHPRLAERAFVLQPLMAVAPDWRLPDGRTVRHLAARLAQRRPAR